MNQLTGGDKLSREKERESWIDKPKLSYRFQLKKTLTLAYTYVIYVLYKYMSIQHNQFDSDTSLGSRSSIIAELGASPFG